MRVVLVALALLAAAPLALASPPCPPEEPCDPQPIPVPLHVPEDLDDCAAPYPGPVGIVKGLAMCLLY